MKISQRLTAGAITLVMGLGLFAIPTSARASEEGRRNTAIGLGVAAGALLLTQKNKIPGIAVAAGAAYAYTRYQDKVNDRHKREKYYGYNDRNYNDRYDDRYYDDRYSRDTGYYNDRDYRYTNRDRNDRYDRNDSNYRSSDRRYNRQYEDRYEDCDNRNSRRR